MNGGAFLAVGVGAVLGAYGRWGLSAWLNPSSPNVPTGTLLANAIGGYLVGLAIGWFAQHPEASPELRLFVITGFLGALTTFSTFSAEAVALLIRAQYLTAFVHIGLHLITSLLLTVGGLYTVNLLARQ
ncbi:MAG TPA: fluoride efflux transporter CrcB [Burkholderiales bacterium]|nr:fluoride efflux transporter CrcB [Burkholderiales bacterium]